ncbi:DegT/DnrJ/EryC1/StrS family aminotransferase, partial [Francisella tularensis]|uniref:DegT/DnrJ/EryC1/StrS family aminotransferase n=1 Tax=Francisella tularensis TaxID=263 RepID=UPI001C0EB047
HVNKIYKNGWLTNNGPLVQELEKRLAKYLGVKNIVLVSNGTIALEIAYRALGVKGSAITTPFSFVATTSSLVSNNVKPVFVDIDENTLSIDVSKIKYAIEEDTSAIVPVHVFGNGCEVEKIDMLAKKHNLKVIYDAAHAFDVKYKGESILNYGDISTLSFHATKIFHSIEGGALIINDDSLVEKVRYFINFGIESSESIPYLGTNAKMNEFEAAMGLCVLDDIIEIKSKRKVITEIYEAGLDGLVKFQEQNQHSSRNYSYFPVIFRTEEELLRVQKALIQNDIISRRYFYPSLDSLSYIEPKQYMPISRDISKRILCLPIYAELEDDKINKIINNIKEVSS